MQIVYLILAHKNPFQLARLVAILTHPNAHFVIHVDGRVEKKIFTEFSKNCQETNIHFLQNRYLSTWGSFELIQATLEGLTYIRKEFATSDRVVFLSGQDYPIKSLDFIIKYFESNPNTIYIEHFKIPFSNWHNGGISRFPFYDRISMQLDIYGGSQWMSFPVYAILVIMDFLETNPEYEEYFRYVFVPDESFFQTLFLNCGNTHITQNLKNDSLHFVNWKQSHMHPAILTEDDFQTILFNKALFARKFDTEQSSKLLSLIDHQIINDYC
jgi:hypothetical protein